MDNEKPREGHSDPNSAPRNTRPSDKDLSELDDPSAGNPDSQPGPDTPAQRPITDNKAGG